MKINKNKVYRIGMVLNKASIKLLSILSSFNIQVSIFETSNALLVKREMDKKGAKNWQE